MHFRALAIAFGFYILCGVIVTWGFDGREGDDWWYVPAQFTCTIASCFVFLWVNNWIEKRQRMRGR